MLRRVDGDRVELRLSRDGCEDSQVFGNRKELLDAAIQKRADLQAKGWKLVRTALWES